MKHRIVHTEDAELLPIKLALAVGLLYPDMRCSNK